MLRRNNTYAVLQFIEAGADVNAVGDMSKTPLHIALKQRNLTATEALLKAGADSSHVSQFGQSPLDLARELGGDAHRLLHNE